MTSPQGQGIKGHQSVQGQEPLPPQPGTQGPPPSPGVQSGMAQRGSPGVGQQPGMGQQPGRPGIAGPFLESVSIDDVIQTDVVTAQPDAPLTEVAERLESEDVGAIVLVEDEEPAGLVTDRKIALSIDEFDDPSETTAEEIATDDLVTGTTTLTVFEVLNRMNDDDIRRLPVVDEDGTLKGIVTLDDLLVLLATELEKAASIIQSQSPRL
ncbi:hypothetical protein BRC66_04060 [Halobacteriales archaeon QH_2_66_30]|nr:MAG: hypothetical protein BRC66_04060 [Halobacteriales archaeon QH_2_66_30]